MPDRVKCLHALIAHELAEPGSNPFGREAILAIGQWWAAGPCVQAAGIDQMAEQGARWRSKVAEKGAQRG
jgi:uncharacterized protein